MQDQQLIIRFALMPLAGKAGRPSEFSRIVVPHPLAHAKIPCDPRCTIRNRRPTVMSMTNGSVDDACWKLRRQAILRHTGKLPIELRAPGAEKLQNLGITRDVGCNAVGRCSYQFPCYAGAFPDQSGSWRLAGWTSAPPPASGPRSTIRRTSPPDARQAVTTGSHGSPFRVIGREWL